MTAITGVILAGGQSRRMGGEDKGLLQLHGQPLYQHVLQRLHPQVDQLLISANRNLSQYRLSGVEVISDSLPDFPGPLAGMLSALQAMKTEWAAFCACDTPFIPRDYVTRLCQQKGNAHAVWVRSAQRDHPALALLHRDLAGPLENYLLRGERRLLHFLLQAGGHAVMFPDDESAFSNINTPEELTSLGAR